MFSSLGTECAPIDLKDAYLCVNNTGRRQISLLHLEWQDAWVHLPPFRALQWAMNVYQAFPSNNGTFTFTRFKEHYLSRWYPANASVERTPPDPSGKVSQQLESLGFIVNQQKSHLAPVQEIQDQWSSASHRRKSRASGRHARHCCISCPQCDSCLNYWAGWWQQHQQSCRLQWNRQLQQLKVRSSRMSRPLMILN